MLKALETEDTLSFSKLTKRIPRCDQIILQPISVEEFLNVIDVDNDEDDDEAPAPTPGPVFTPNQLNANQIAIIQKFAPTV